MGDNKDDMEDGEISDDSNEEGPLYQYTPLARPVDVNREKTIKSSNVSDGEYSSDNEPPGVGVDSDSDSDEDFSKPKAKQSRQGLWARRDALVPDDGGGDTFKKMAAAFQMQRDVQGLNKKKKRNNVWGNFIQEETLNTEMTGSLGVGVNLKDLDSDRGAETYDYTQIIKERQEEERRRKLEEKNSKGSKLDDEMDSYWNNKDDMENEEVEDKESDIKEDIADNGTEAQDDKKRGTKRSVRDRLGDKKVRLDRYRNEVLPPPGAPRQIPDVAEENVLEGTDEEFGAEIAGRLQEEKVEMIVDLIKILGRRKVWEFFQETQKVEAKGGMMINNGARRRTAGGVLMHLLRTTQDTETADKAKEFFRESQKNEQKRRMLHAKSKKKKKFEEEMKEFLDRKREMAEERSKEEDGMEEDVKEEEELKPLPNILSMIASSLNKDSSEQTEKSRVTEASANRVASFKEPEAPPNSVERIERNLIDYEDDDFLSTNNDSEDIELF